MSGVKKDIDMVRAVQRVQDIANTGGTSIVITNSEEKVRLYCEGTEKDMRLALASCAINLEQFGQIMIDACGLYMDHLEKEEKS